MASRSQPSGDMGPIAHAATKACTKCGEMKPVEAFNRDRNRRDGRNPQCKACARASIKAWEVRNGDRVRAYGRAWHHRHPEWQVGYQAANPDACRAYRAKYRAANRERCRQDNRDRASSLTDAYVRKLLGFQGDRAKLVPPVLVEAKRQHLRAIRTLKEKS